MTTLLIATPTYDGTVSIQYMDAVINLTGALAARDAGVRRYFLRSTLVAWARNAYATAALEDASVSHLLFIDADMGFRPSAVLRMLDFDKPFVGCLYPHRALNPARQHAVAHKSDDPAAAWSAGLSYVAADRLVPEPSGGIRVTDGFAKAWRLGMGLTLIRRDALERLSEAHPELWADTDTGYRNMGLGERVFQPFDSYRAASGLSMSEDMSFCRRWTDLRGEIWACVDEPVTHVGPIPLTGAYVDSLRIAPP